MLVIPLTPQLTMEWFERTDHQHEALCLFLTANPLHRDLIAEFIRNQINADTALGRNFGFIVSDSGSTASHKITTDHGRQFLLPGEAIHLQQFDLISSSSSEDDDRPGLPKRPTEEQFPSDVGEKSNLEWLDFFSLEKTQKPVLCVLIKGCDPFSTSLNDDLSLPRLPRLLGEISDIADHNSRIDPHTIPDFKRKLAKTVQLSERLVEKEKELIDLFDTLAKISDASDPDRAKITEHLSSKKFSPEGMKQLLKGLDFYLSPEFKHRKTITGVMNKSRAIEKLRAELHVQAPTQSECESISATVERISERRSNVRSLIQKLARENFCTSSVDRSQIARRYDAYSLRLDASSHVVGKISSMLSQHDGGTLLLAKLMSLSGNRAAP